MKETRTGHGQNVGKKIMDYVNLTVFSGNALTSYHTLDGLSNPNLLSKFWRLEMETKASANPRLPKPVAASILALS